MFVEIEEDKDCIEQSNGFVIDSDGKAEWAMRKIAEERADAQRLIMVCTAAIDQYKEKIVTYTERQKGREDRLCAMLYSYFEQVPHKVTKTTESYELPAGKLRLKHQKPEFVRDDDKLVEFLRGIGENELIKTKHSPDWALFKDRVAVVGDSVVDKQTGEVVDGVTVVERQPEFKVEV